MSALGLINAIQNVRNSTAHSRRPVKPTTTRADCPLSSPNIGLITETDHRVGLCLCPLCTCGTHECPSNRRPEPYLKSAYTTSYCANFQTKQNWPPVKVSYKKPFLPSKAVEFTTTSSDTYLLPRTRNGQRGDYQDTPAPLPSIEFSARSAYASNFPN